MKRLIIAISIACLVGFFVGYAARGYAKKDPTQIKLTRFMEKGQSILDHSACEDGYLEWFLETSPTVMKVAPQEWQHVDDYLKGNADSDIVCNARLRVRLAVLQGLVYDISDATISARKN